MMMPCIFFALFIFLLSTVNVTLSEPPKPPDKHFVLIHGACHGAWSWYKLVPLLKSSGDNVTAIDLAASGVNPQQVNTLRSVSDYLRPLTDFMKSLPPHEKVILVGHSFGGMAISQAMERFPNKISVAVFGTALMPGPTLGISTLYQEIATIQGFLLDSKYTYGNGPNNPPTTLIFGPLYLLLDLYQLSPIEDWALATMLMRPFPLFSVEDMTKEIVLTKENYGSVNRFFIISENDTLKEDFQRWMIENNPPNGMEEIRGSYHMVMMSKPIELWANLLAIAKKYT